MGRPYSTCFFNCSVNTGFQSTVIQIMVVHSLLTSQNRFFRLTQLLTSGHLFIIPKVKLVWNVHTRQLELSSACIQTHNWPDFLSPICFGLNTTPRTELANYTPAELFFGRKFQPIATLHLRNQQALSRNPNYTAYMEQLNLKLKVITDTVKVAEKICQDANKSRLDKRTPLTTFHQGQKVLYFQLPAQGTCSKLSPRFNQIFEIISIDPLYQTAQLRDSNGAMLSKRVHLSKLKPFFERNHSTNHLNKSSATSVDTTAPCQINLPVQTTVVPNASGKTYQFKHQCLLPRHHRSIQATRPGTNNSNNNNLRFTPYNPTILSLPALAQRQSVFTSRDPSFHLSCLPQTLSGGVLVSSTDPMPRNIPISDHPCPLQNVKTLAPLDILSCRVSNRRNIILGKCSAFPDKPICDGIIFFRCSNVPHNFHLNSCTVQKQILHLHICLYMRAFFSCFCLLQLYLITQQP